MEPMEVRQELVLRLARALHEAGVPAHRLEAAIEAVSSALGLEVSVVSQPTSLILDLGTVTRVMRVSPATADLGRMVEIDTIASAVSRGSLSPSAAVALLSTPRPPSALSVWLGPASTAVTAGTAAVFFAAPPLAVGVSAGLGLLVGLLDRLAAHHAAYKRVHEIAASFLVAAVATALGRVLPVSATLVTLAGIVSLLPGLSITVALTELATRHLASGTARLMGAVVTLLQLGIGTALGWRLAAVLPRALKPVGEAPGELVQFAMVPIAATAFVVVFRARLRDWPWIVAVSLVGFAAAREGQWLLGPELGACVGGLVVGLASNLQAVLRRVPTSVTQMPGLLLLVPGSVGFRGFGAMLDHDVDAGVNAGFRMLVIAGSLVAGLLAAGVFLPPRRYL
jgi:uncharacterized membrane protein YjjP (DUF1212 family)